MFALTARRVAMGNTHGHTRPLCRAKRKDGKRIDVAVYNLPALLFKEALKLSLIFNYMLIGRNLKYPATQRFDFNTRNKG